MPGQPDHALASMGIYVFETRFLMDALRQDAADPDSSHDFGKDMIPAIVRGGKAVAHRFAAVLRAQLRRGGGLLARRRHRRRLLAGQHRPDRLHPGARPLRPGLADLDLCRDHAARPSSSTTRASAAARRSARSSPAAASSPAASIRRSLLFTGVHTHSFAAIEAAVVLPYAEIGRGARLRNVVVDRGVRIPDGLVVGEDPELDAAALPPHRARRLPDHPADDRRARNEGRAVHQGIPAERLRRRRRPRRISQPRARPAECRSRSAPSATIRRIAGNPAVRFYPEWPEAKRGTDPRFAGAVDAFERSLRMAKDRLDADLVHCHTWYTDMARHPRRPALGRAQRADDPLARAAPPLEGRAARPRLPPERLDGAHRDRAGQRRHRRLPRDARRRAAPVRRRARSGCT